MATPETLRTASPRYIGHHGGSRDFLALSFDRSSKRSAHAFEEVCELECRQVQLFGRWTGVDAVVSRSALLKLVDVTTMMT